MDDITKALLATVRVNLLLLDGTILPRIAASDSQREVRAGCRMLLGAIEDALGVPRTVPTAAERRRQRDLDIHTTSHRG